MYMFMCNLFSIEGFPPRWQCGSGWTPVLGWTHILSDIGIWLAYMAIPITMWIFARKRDDLRFPPVFWLFTAFILFCGFTHLLEAMIFYWPVYRLAGVMKLATAIVSLATVVALIKIMPTALDVPDLAKLNKALRHEVKRRERVERRYRALIATATTAVWRSSFEGFLVDQQPSWEAYTGQSFDQYQGEGWGSAIHQDDLPVVRKKLQAAVTSGQDYEAECRMWSQHHHAYRWMLARGTPVRDEQGEIVEWVGAMIDVDEEHRLAEELIAVNSALENRNEQSRQFLYTVSHDLKSPVVTIRGFLEFIRSDLESGKHDRLDHFVNRIDEASEIMSRSLSDLLELSRVGFVSSDPQPVDLNGVVSEIVEMFEPELKTRDAQIEVQPDMPTVLMDQHHAHQLYQNLLENAMKYACGPGGGCRIYVEFERGEKHLNLSVRDEGPGIDTKHHDRIFRVFERLQNKTKGTGVGLSIVRQIADNYSGTVKVESPPVGRERGCCFIVQLPLDIEV